MGTIGRAGFKQNASCAAGAVGRHHRVIASPRLARLIRRAEPATARVDELLSDSRLPNHIPARDTS
jgi:hypothetical protein